MLTRLNIFKRQNHNWFILASSTMRIPLHNTALLSSQIHKNTIPKVYFLDHYLQGTIVPILLISSDIEINTEKNILHSLLPSAHLWRAIIHTYTQIHTHTKFQFYLVYHFRHLLRKSFLLSILEIVFKLVLKNQSGRKHESL